MQRAAGDRCARSTSNCMLKLSQKGPFLEHWIKIQMGKITMDERILMGIIASQGWRIRTAGWEFSHGLVIYWADGFG
jgi:hypothetical protein